MMISNPYSPKPLGKAPCPAEGLFLKNIAVLLLAKSWLIKIDDHFLRSLGNDLLSGLL
jgi:hypothetical protein